MKHKPNYLKSSMSALALSLALLGGIPQPGPIPGSTNPSTERPTIEDGNLTPGNDEDEGLQPLSDLDEREKMIEA